MQWYASMYIGTVVYFYGRRYSGVLLHRYSGVLLRRYSGVLLWT